MSEPRPSARLPREDPTGLAPLVERIDQWLRTSRAFPELEKDRASLESLLAQIRARQASLETPLRILLLGGTGVGKSTLFNALAGDELAQVGAVRPVTRDLTAYYHEQNSTASLGPLEGSKKTKLIPHRRDGLLDKVVIDAPDFDSTVDANRALLLATLAAADLALCVLSPQKYVAADLFRLLVHNKSGVEYVFVLNQIDRTHDAEAVVADLRRELAKHRIKDPRVLAVSSLAVRETQLEASAAGWDPLAEDLELPPGAGEWPELRELLEQELDRVRIREIKAAKLADRVRSLLARIGDHVPGEVPEKVQSWRQAWEESRHELRQDLAALFFGALRHDHELKNVLRYSYGTQGFAAPFGVFMTAVYGARSFLLPGYAQARTFSIKDLETLMEERLQLVPIERVERNVRLVLDRFESEGRQRGFAPAFEQRLSPVDADVSRRRFLRRDAGEAAAGGAAQLVVEVRAEASRRFYEFFRERTEGDGTSDWLAKHVWNAFLYVLIGLVLVGALGSLFGGTAGSISGGLELVYGQLMTGLGLLLFLCAVLWPFAEQWVIEPRVERSFAQLEGVVEQATETCLGGAVVEEPERVLSEILAAHREFEALTADAAKILPETEEPVRAAQPQAPLSEDAPDAIDPQDVSAPPEAPPEDKTPLDQRERESV